MLALDLNKHSSHVVNKAVQCLHELKALGDKHKIWSNPLLKACEAGNLKLIDFKLLFSEYYLYSKNFSRLLAALMTNCENDYFRSKLAENLWEESGENELEKRHAEIFRCFLKDKLNIDLTTIKFNKATRSFVKQYIDFCKNRPELEVTAALALGTEGIVSKLYAIFRNGLLNHGFKDEDLLFFNIHIACDDDHAYTLEEMLISFFNEKDWFERSKNAMNEVLDLRNTYFQAIYDLIVETNLEPLINRASNATFVQELTSALVFDTQYCENEIYYNKNDESNIDFHVHRLPFNASILDPRLVSIPAGFQNEYHSHAHETIILILQGEGEMLISGKTQKISKDNIIYVPRWSRHQTKNTGNMDLKFFAITDYGFTKHIPLNTETSYRNKK